MTRFLIIGTIIFFLLSCNNNTGASGSAATGPLKITGRCAVFYTPGEAKLRQLKNAFGEKDFPDIAAANQQYMEAARQFLTKQQVKIITTSNDQLLFVKGNGEQAPVNLNYSKYAWEIFLFNGFDDPVKIDMTNVEEEYQDAKMNN
jgi:hypothetical protein